MRDEPGSPFLKLFPVRHPISVRQWLAAVVSDGGAFPTSLVAQYLTTPAAALACAVYTGVFVAINAAYNLLWWAASRHRRLLHAGVTPIQVKRHTRNILFGFPVYLLATLLAFWNLYVSLGLCSCLWIFWAFTFYERNPSSALDHGRAGRGDVS